MDFRSVFTLCIFAFVGCEATLTFYDYGIHNLYAANVSLINKHIEDFGFYKFHPKDFRNGSYDILNGPLFISFAPPDHVEQRAYYIPNGLAHVEDYDSYDVPAIFEYTPFFTYFSNSIRSKSREGFTPTAAEVAAPEFFFYNLTGLVFGERELPDMVPFLFLAPHHTHPENFFRGHFRKFAEFTLYQPFKPNPLLGTLFQNVASHKNPLLVIDGEDNVPHLTTTFPAVIATHT